MNKKQKKPVLLCILDGWGIGKNDKKINAIFAAKTPNYDSILKNYPNSKLGADSHYVGLPDKQIGNSEVGHMTIGSGRIIYQDLPKINKAIEEGSLEKNIDLKNLIKNCQKNDKSCHILGLLSPGGVHSHENHIFYLAKKLAKSNIKVKLHAFLDGRDVSQKSALESFSKLNSIIKEFNNISLATICGRYYAMDRDQNWDRIKLAYDCICNNNAKKFNDVKDAISYYYNKDLSDEFIEPTIIGDYNKIQDGESLIIANFRADRIRQITNALISDDFDKFQRRKIEFSSKIAMTHYCDNLSKYLKILFPSDKIKNSLGEILEKNNLKQLRIAETEKYAHVTFFFSAGQEQKFKGEDRILINSPKVATYDLKPEMSASQVTVNLIEAIQSDKYDFILVNFANPDMVGHSGKLKSAIEACEIIDEKLNELKNEILNKDAIMIVSADHGNIENMITTDNKPHTAHTNNPVPFIIIGNDVKNIKLKDGSLANIAPTILDLMNIEKPTEMTHSSLIEKYN
jgi:2,3-bisphosphoglycerate-independent phosphoglycerate mutase